MKTFEIVLSEERGVTMTMYLNLESPEFGIVKRPLMIVLPGGAYAVCSDRESEIVALQYMAAGYQACVLRYTLSGRGGWPDPINDYDECMEVIEKHAGEWHIDMSRCAVAGFSAGGHLAACAATVARHKPRAAVCIYPAILRPVVDACQPGMPYPHEHVDGRTSPCFIAASRDDGVVNVSNSLALAQALERAGVTFELHIYSFGPHGFSIGTPLLNDAPLTPRAARWVADSIGWLGEIMGELTNRGFTEPVLPPRLNADCEPVLSVGCTLAHIRRQPENVQAVMEPFYSGLRAAAGARGVPFEDVCGMIGRYRLGDLMAGLLGVPEEAVKQLDAVLRTFPNPDGE